MECSQEDCQRGSYGKKTICFMHYKRMWRHGTFLTKKRRSKTGLCEIKGCDKKHLALGLCSKHYVRSSHMKKVRKKYEQSAKIRMYRKAYNNLPIRRIRSSTKAGILYRTSERYRKSIEDSVRSLAGKMRQRQHAGIRKTRYKWTNITKDWLLLLWESSVFCGMCNERLDDDRQLDHIIPINIGGRHVKANVRFLCPSCNLKRPRKGQDLHRVLFLLPNNSVL